MEIRIYSLIGNEYLLYSNYANKLNDELIATRTAGAEQGEVGEGGGANFSSVSFSI